MMLRPTDYTLAEKNSYGDLTKYRFEAILAMKYPYPSTIDITYDRAKKEVVAAVGWGVQLVPIIDIPHPLVDGLVEHYISHRLEN